MKEICVFTDGGCWPNPGGPMSYSIFVLDNFLKINILKGISLQNVIVSDPLLLEITRSTCVNSSNNVAEYLALYRFIDIVLMRELYKNKIMVYSDSMMMVNQMSGKWAVRNGAYKFMHDAVTNLMRSIDSWNMQFIFVHREENIAGVLLEEWQRNEESKDIKFYSNRL